MDLFDFNSNKANDNVPLAERMRPHDLEEFVGQEHMLGKGKVLRNLIETDKISNMILQGPPATGKTSLAFIISQMTQSEFIKLNAVSLSISELRTVIETAKDNLKLYNKKTIVFIDEIHAMKSNVQMSLLPVVENGTFILIGATTESVMHDIIPPLASRCRIYHLNPLSKEDIQTIVKLALTDTHRGFGIRGITIEAEALAYLVDISNGDIRNALNALETAIYSLYDKSSIDLEVIQEAFQFRLNNISTNDFYNLTSAFIKSMRAGHTDGALYWLARMLYSGVDPLYIARRIVVHSTEDVGMANPNALQIAMAAKQALEFVGMPEARMALSQAVIYICESPKSNSAYKAINSALETVKNTHAYDVPNHLKDGSKTYINPIDNPQSKLQYLPDQIKDKRFYKPQNAGVESKIYIKHDKKHNGNTNF
jgi:putative ATPase